MRFTVVFLVAAIAALASLSAAFEYKNEVLRDVHQFAHHKPVIRSALPQTYLKSSDLPKEFTWANVDGVNYVSRVLNQHVPQYCGSCWAHGTASSVVDRLKIMRKNAYPDISVAIQDVLNCGRGSAGSCNGGTSNGMFAYMKKNGLPIEACAPYEASNGECTPARRCGDCSGPYGSGTCWPLKNYTTVFVDEYGSTDSDVDSIKKEIYARGPVSAGINAIPLLNVTGPSPVIIDNCAAQDKYVNHVVRIIGWREHEDYGTLWVMVNSWGPNSGDVNGVFHVIAGENCLGSEEYIWWAVPRLG